MLEALISSKTRIRLLLRFFLNPESKSYLSELAEEFGESTNSVRLELNRFEKAGMLDSEYIGNKRFYRCLLYTSPSPRDKRQSRMPSSA